MNDNRQQDKPTTITAKEFIDGGYAEKIVHGECVVLDPFPMENVRVIGIDVLYDSALAEFHVRYADVVDDPVKVSAYHKFNITWLPQSATTTAKTDTVDGLTMLTRAGGSKTFYRAYNGVHEVFYDTLDTVTPLETELATVKAETINLAANLDHVSTQWVQLHQHISKALGLEFAPEEDIERYGEAIAALQAALAKAEAENKRLLSIIAAYDEYTGGDCPFCEGTGEAAVGFDDNPNVYETIFEECKDCRGSGKVAEALQAATDDGPAGEAG